MNTRIHIDWSSLVPDRYAAWRPLVADALEFFVERLPAERRTEILIRQASLPPDATLLERLALVLPGCPTLHKLGQVLARNQALAADLRALLQTLESLAPHSPIEPILARLQAELPDLAEQGVALADQALAEGSVAVVVPFTWPRNGETTTGVFKVLRPRIEAVLAAELEIWAQLADHVDERRAGYGLGAVAVRDTFELVRDLLLSEIRLDCEQDHLRIAAAQLAGEPGVAVPAVLPFCTPSVTAMQRVDGALLGAAIPSGWAARGRLAGLLTRALLANPFWSSSPSALFHGDPHAGNLLVRPDGVLVPLDWSLAGQLEKPHRIAIVQMLLSAVLLDEARLCNTTEALALAPVQPQRLRAVAAAGLAAVRSGRLPGLRWLAEYLDRAAREAGVRFGGELLLFRKSLLTLEGVIADVDPTFSPDATLLAGALERLVLEWPGRAAADLVSRAFRTHLSTADLLTLAWSLPTTATRLWFGHVHDWLGRLSSVAPRG